MPLWSSPAFYFLDKPSGEQEDEMRTVAVMTTHVDDLLFSTLPEGEETMQALLNRFDMGAEEVDDFRYCGKQLGKTE